MKRKTLYLACYICWILAVWCLFQFWQKPELEIRAIYNETADGSQQICDALLRAKKENKRVLLQFGANWCGWCHRLHRFFETEKSVNRKLQANYVIALIDVNDGHNRTLVNGYGEPTKFGIPVILVLDSDGKLLVTAENGSFIENGYYDSKKTGAFLDKWAVGNSKELQRPGGKKQIGGVAGDGSGTSLMDSSP